MHALQFTNKYRERFFFVATGATHFSAGLARTIHLIDATTTDIAKARHFDTKGDAELIMARTGNAGVQIDAEDRSVGWEIVPV